MSVAIKSCLFIPLPSRPGWYAVEIVDALLICEINTSDWQ